MRSRVRETLECPSVCLSVPSFDSRNGVRVASLLLSASPAVDLGRLQAPALSTRSTAANACCVVLTAELTTPNTDLFNVGICKVMHFESRNKKSIVSWYW